MLDSKYMLLILKLTEGKMKTSCTSRFSMGVVGLRDWVIRNVPYRFRQADFRPLGFRIDPTPKHSSPWSFNGSKIYYGAIRRLSSGSLSESLYIAQLVMCELLVPSILDIPKLSDYCVCSEVLQVLCMTTTPAAGTRSL